MNLNDIPEPSKEDLVQSKYLIRAYSRIDENQDYNLKSSVRVIAHLIRQGKVLARIVTDIGPRLTSEEESAIKTFEEIE